MEYCYLPVDRQFQNPLDVNSYDPVKHQDIICICRSKVFFKKNRGLRRDCFSHYPLVVGDDSQFCPHRSDPVEFERLLKGVSSQEYGRMARDYIIRDKQLLFRYFLFLKNVLGHHGAMRDFFGHFLGLFALFDSKGGWNLKHIGNSFYFFAYEMAVLNKFTLEYDGKVTEYKYELKEYAPVVRGARTQKSLPVKALFRYRFSRDGSMVESPRKTDYPIPADSKTFLRESGYAKNGNSTSMAANLSAISEDLFLAVSRQK